MEIIERYLYAIGKHLPGKERADILAELRAALEDGIEARPDGTTAEAAAMDIIRGMGAPDKVAASYHPTRQYLIGPELFPLFKLVAGIVLTAVTGAQLIAVLVSLLVSGEPVAWLNQLWGIVESLPAALGFVVLTFFILQTLEVKPELSAGPFDPAKLPPVEHEEPVNRFEQIFGMIFSLVFLTLFAGFFQAGGFTWDSGIHLLENPIIAQYFPLIALSFGLDILLSVVLLWRGRWQVGTRAAAILSNGFTLYVLTLLIRGHDALLAEYGLSGFFVGWADRIPELIEAGPAAVIVGFRFGLTVAAVIVALEMFVFAYRLVRSLLRREQAGSLAAVSIR